MQTPTDTLLRSARFGLGVGLVALTATACATKEPSAVSVTTLEGTTALSSYPSTPRTVQATDESGRVSHATVNADGSFKLALARAHTYRVEVVTDRGPVPLVFPRASGKVTTTFALKSDGAHLALGRVRYVLRTATVPLETKPTKLPALRIASLASGAGASDDCEDCGNDDQDVACEDGSHGSGGTSAEMEGADDEAGSSGEASIAEHNVPENVDGCGENNDDGENQQDGEHQD